MELSQNSKALLQDIAESSVLLELSMRLHGNEKWSVNRNYTEKGCDLIIFGPDRKIKIEVKARQNVITKNPNRGNLHFTVSEVERNESDFVVAYWFDRRTYFVVPTERLTETASGTKKLFKFIANYSKRQGRFTGLSAEFHEAWSLITEALN